MHILSAFFGTGESDEIIFSKQRRGEEEVKKKMEFSYKELATLNKIISIALLSGEIEMNETTKTIQEKVANAIVEMAKNEES